MNKVQIVRRTALIVGIILVSCLVISRVIRWNEVAAVQNALQRNWEIEINSSGCPKYLPAFLDDFVERSLEEAYNPDPEVRNRDIVYHERFRSLFRGPIRNLITYDVEEFDESLGSAISHLTSLETLEVMGSVKERVTDEDWKALFHGITKLPNLHELEIGGGRITNNTFAALAGASKLRKLSITFADIDLEFASALPLLPALTELRIKDVWNEEPSPTRGLGITPIDAPLVRNTQISTVGYSGDWEADDLKTFLESLARFPNLRELNIDSKSLTNELLAALAGAPKLETLTVSGPVDADCASFLKALPALKKLEINSTLAPSPNNQGLSEPSLSNLRAALPNVRVNVWQ